MTIMVDKEKVGQGAGTVAPRYLFFVCLFDSTFLLYRVTVFFIHVPCTNNPRSSD